MLVWCGVLCVCVLRWLCVCDVCCVWCVVFCVCTSGVVSLCGCVWLCGVVCGGVGVVCTCGVVCCVGCLCVCVWCGGACTHAGLLPVHTETSLNVHTEAFRIYTRGVSCLVSFSLSLSLSLSSLPFTPTNTVQSTDRQTRRPTLRRLNVMWRTVRS